ncbi:uncharacterized protein LOC132624602 [Lycium barbarum]|uniref:uncharacterized protein LOC132624602 n=1 Tax=Lycium barbarum TaxID=112863 RepID=UPI00293F238C|nr:uncharacterized protein LOC132624602 [Lycium barbarum]
MLIPNQASWMVKKIIEARVAASLLQTVNNGKQLIRQTYLRLLDHTIRVPWKCYMFRNATRTKAIFTLWLHFQDRLPTRERLLNWGMDIDAGCMFCTAFLETRNHMFVECVFSQAVWTRLMQWLQNQNYNARTWEQHLTWSLTHGKGKSQKSQIFKLVYTEGVHAIWLKRNQRVFEGQSRSVEQITKDVAFACNVRVAPRISGLLQTYLF